MYSRTEWKSKPAGRRRSSRRPAPPIRPASLNSVCSSTSRGCTTIAAPAGSTASETDSSPRWSPSSIRASEIAKRPRGSRPRSRSPAARRPCPRSRHSYVPSRASEPRATIEPTGMREARWTSILSRTRSPSVAGAGSAAWTTETGPRTNPAQTRATPAASRRPIPPTASGREPNIERGEGDAGAEQQRAAELHAGTRVSVSASRTASAPSVPAARASGETMTRWESTATATACTSSGRT